MSVAVDVHVEGSISSAAQSFVYCASALARMAETGAAGAVGAPALVSLGMQLQQSGQHQGLKRPAADEEQQSDPHKKSKAAAASPGENIEEMIKMILDLQQTLTAATSLLTPPTLAPTLAAAVAASEVSAPSSMAASGATPVNGAHIYIYIYIHTYMYIYICRERDVYHCIYIYIYYCT